MKFFPFFESYGIKKSIHNRGKKMVKSQQNYPVIWLIEVLRRSKGSRYTFSLGLCGKTRKVAFVTRHHPKRVNLREIQKIIVIKDLFVNDVCEDALWCWNLKCSYNKAKKVKFKHFFGFVPT
jgi:hypothetical protein